MANQNYRESIEKDRQEIAVPGSESLSRRTQRKGATHKPKKKKNVLLPSLFFIFILLPVMVLVYVAFFFEPDDTLTTNAVENEVSFETNPQPESPLVPVDTEEQEKKEAEKAAAKKVAAEKAEADKAKEEAAKAKEEAAKAKEEQDAAKVQQDQQAAAEKAAAEKAAAEKQKAAAKAKPTEPKKQPKEETKPETGAPAQKSVVVKSNETLYRIAVNNYGASQAAAAVEKIKQANGLASNEISVGQTLILP
ncbi:LysM peptidoglycan-binding domain-containing protein [Planococcus sp. YIM B11945]|uniref:LysM peptidoglycan-binding domain-containing protein n=1 Tax=Planococcus sp. YIM B11945 TaxID=3435410 RepID=UPI003D7E58B3